MSANGPALAGAILIALSANSVPALADDPKDPAMQSREARERDAAEIRRLNREQLRYVQRRDAEYAKGWEAQQNYKAELAEYERQMAKWREAVRRCKAGDHRFCKR